MKQDSLTSFPWSIVHGPWKNYSGFFRGLWSVVCGLMLVHLAGCATVYNPATQRRELIFISSAEEVQIGRSMSEVIIKKEAKPLEDPARQRALNIIGNRIAQVSDRREIVYRFMILDNEDLNAFALPGGYIYVYSGLFNRLPEPELAAVVAHEIAHVAAKHAVKRMQSALGYDALLLLVSVGLGNKNPVLVQQLSGVSNTVFDLLSRGYSRGDELEADRLAVRYLSQAGYDPQGLVRALEFLLYEKGPSGRVFEILSTHPRMEERIKKIKEQIELTKVNDTK